MRTGRQPLRSFVRSITLTVSAGLAASSCSLLDLESLTDDGAGGTGGETTGSTVGAGGADGGASTTSTTAGGSATTSSTAMSSSGTGGLDPILEDCVLLLHLDEDDWAGDAGVKDSSGSNNHGTASGVVPVPGGKFGNAASFPGSGRIVIPHSSSLQPTDGLTYMAWVMPASLSGDPGIFSKRVGFGNEVAFTMFLADSADLGGEVTWWGDIESSRFRSNVPATVNDWHHLTIVYDGTATQSDRVKLYLDGVATSVPPNSPAPATMGPNTVDLSLGNLPGGGGFFTGRMDEVVVWRRALSAAEVTYVFTLDDRLQGPSD